jgi:hypothetical protein
MIDRSWRRSGTVNSVHSVSCDGTRRAASPAFTIVPRRGLNRVPTYKEQMTEIMTTT